MAIERYREKYAVAGAILALGAPVGAVLIRCYPQLTVDFISSELHGFVFFYVYMLCGTVIVFSLYGFVLGRQADEIAAQRQKFYRDSIHDPLTGTYNRRYFDERFHQELERAKRYQSPLSYLMFDIDCFKKINDTQGHSCGDMVLVTIAQIVQERLREYDVLARYSGDEFVILLPQTDHQPAYLIAEEIREKIKEHAFPIDDAKSISVTISIGLASYPDEDVENQQQMKKIVDEFLYEAKKKGRNQTAKRRKV